MEERIKNILHKMTKIKELNIYFQELRQETGLLEADVQKFLSYTPKDNNLRQKL